MHLYYWLDHFFIAAIILYFVAFLLVIRASTSIKLNILYNSLDQWCPTCVSRDTVSVCILFGASLSCINFHYAMNNINRALHLLLHHGDTSSLRNQIDLWHSTG